MQAETAACDMLFQGYVTCCADGTQNAVHGSDSPASAAREIAFFFPGRTAMPLHEPVTAAMSAEVEATLCKGLTELARTKPSSDPAVAIQWLGKWLLENNPANPKTVGPQRMTLDDVDDGKEMDELVRKAQQADLKDVPSGSNASDAVKTGPAEGADVCA